MASELDAWLEKSAETARRIDQSVDVLKASIETVLAEHRRMRRVLAAIVDGAGKPFTLSQVAGFAEAALSDIPERG
jgi:hypothetical protein